MSISLTERYMHRYVQFLQKRKYCVVITWVLVTAVLGFTGAIRLMGHCKNEFSAPVDSPSGVARKRMTSYFGDFDSLATDILYFETADGEHILDDGVLKDLTNMSKAYLSSRLGQGLFEDLELEGYYVMLDKGPPFNATAKNFLSEDGTSSFVLLQYPSANTHKYGEAFLAVVHKFRGQIAASSKVQFVGGAGAGVSTVEASRAAVESIERMDSISLPIAFVVLAITLRSIRLLMVPLITLFVGMIVSFGIMGLISDIITVSSATPAVMMSMLLAISIDYVLFLLSRFQEELRGGSHTEAAVHQMLVHSGHTICCSGFTLAFCFVSLLFFPLQLMQSIGLGNIVSILTAITVNLTIVPAILLMCPLFLVGPHVETPAGTIVETPSKLLEGTRWFRWAIFSASRPALVSVVMILVGLGIISSMNLSSLMKSMDTFMMMPRHDMTTQTASRFGRSFSRGQTGQYQLLLVPAGSQTIYDQKFWTDAGSILAAIAASFEGDSKTRGTIASVLYEYNADRNQSGHPMSMELAKFIDPSMNESAYCDTVPHNLTKACRKFLRTKNCADLLTLQSVFPIGSSSIRDFCGLFQLALHSTATPTRSAAYATLTPSETPGSQAAVDFARRCRQVLANNKQPYVEAHLSGGTPELMDAIDEVYSRLPVVLAVTMACCCVLLGLLTVSVAFGIMSVALILWTGVVVFALGVAVYQDGAFGPQAPTIITRDGGLAWMIPALTFSIILGLGLDYTIFLLLRVCELRVKGYAEHDAFVYGVAMTGPVITSAGLIMATAFSGLMLSSVPMLNQEAWLLVTAVLIDTFFVACLATPAIQSPLGKLNWWPRRVAPVGGLQPAVVRRFGWSSMGDQTNSMLRDTMGTDTLRESMGEPCGSPART